MNKKLEKNFGVRVEELLQKRNVKPQDFYNAVEIIPQNFYDWKKKGSTPNAATALKIAKYLGVTIEYLLTGDDDNPLQKKVEELQERLRNIAEYVQKQALC